MPGAQFRDISTRKRSAEPPMASPSSSGKIPCRQISNGSNSSSSSRELRRIYNKVDENGDGVLTIAEIRLYLKKLGIQMSEEDISSVVSPLCHNGHGSLRFEEFAAWCESALEEEDDDAEGGDLLDAFRVFDKDEDGYISSTELQQILTALGFAQGHDLANCQRMISSFDLDSNGLLDFCEFKHMMSREGFRVMF